MSTSEEDLKQLRANADSLASCLHSLLQRIETIEMGKNGEKSARSGAESPLRIQTDEQQTRTETKTEHGVKKITTTKTVKTREIHAVAVDSGSSWVSPRSSPSPSLPASREVVMQARQLQLIKVLYYQCRLLITGVERGANLDLSAGDIIRYVDGRAVSSELELRSATGQITLTVRPALLYEAPSQYLRIVKPYEDAEENFSLKAGEVVQALLRIDKERRFNVRSISNPSNVGSIWMSTEVERVTLVSPYGRNIVALVGARGVGRRTLKSLLLRQAPQLFATAVPLTSREPKPGELEGREYQFWRKEDVLQAIRDHAMIEWGELDNQLYGTRADDVREVVESGRLCILDCAPNALPYLYNSIFKPLVVHIKAPELEEAEQLEQLRPKIRTREELESADKFGEYIATQYERYIHLTLVNRNTDVTFKKLLTALEELRSNAQCIPVQWSPISNATAVSRS